MKVSFIRPSYQRFYAAHKQEIDAAIQKCLKNGDLTLREEVWKFEKSLAKLIGTKYAVGVASGTDALFLSLKALGIGPGDEVITVSHTFIASLQAIVHCGATPVLVDVNHDELIDTSQIEKAITKRTKAILPVHYTGKVCDMQAIMKIAIKHRLFVVEDACQSLGASCGKKMAGSFGDTGCFSFNTAKLLGAYGDAGAITTNNRKLYKKLALLRNHWNMSQLSVRKEDFPQPKKLEWGWKSRLDNIQAAVLNVKLKYIGWMLKRRGEIANKYTDFLCCNRYPISDITWTRYGFSCPHDDLLFEGQGRIWQEYHMRVENRARFVKYMKSRGIELLVRDTTPNHKQSGLGLSHFNLPVTERLAKEIVRLPLYPEMTDREVRYVAKTIQDYFTC